MLFPEPMTEVMIIVPKSKRDETIEDLKGIIHLGEVRVQNTRPLHLEVEKVSDLLSRLESLIGQLKPQGWIDPSMVPLTRAEEIVLELETRLNRMNEKKTRINGDIKRLESMQQLIHSTLFIGSAQLFSDSPEGWEIKREDFKKKNLQVLGTYIHEQQVLVLAKGAGGEFRGDSRKLRSLLLTKIAALNEELKGIDGEKETLKKEYGAQMNVLKVQLGMEIRTLKDEKKVAGSELFVYIKGWVPTKWVRLIKVDGILLTKDAGEDAPTKLDNPPMFRPFEQFMYSFALPTYGEFDPTPFLAIFMPLFYGVMLSDAGYGLMLLLFALFMKPNLGSFADMLVVFAIVTIGFGIIFDSYFGFQLGTEVINPLTRPFDLIYYSIIFGVFYVDLGLIMGIIQNLLSDKYWEALTQQGSLLIFQFGLAVCLYNLGIGLVMATLGLVLKVWVDKLRGALEIPGFIANILSFCRLAALAMATTWIGFTVNFIFRLLLQLHVVAILPALIVLVIGHSGNFVFNAFGSFIHALRLHYVEFMGMFFSGKGKRFTPLGS